MSNLLSVLGRIMIASIFILSGLSKIGNYSGTIGYMTSKGIPVAPLFLYGAVFFEVIGGLMVATGFKAKYGLYMLIAFLIPTTIIFHGNIADKAEMVQCLKNVSILGALVFMLANGAGKWALGKE